MPVCVRAIFTTALLTVLIGLVPAEHFERSAKEVVRRTVTCLIVRLEHEADLSFLVVRIGLMKTSKFMVYGEKFRAVGSRFTF